MCDEIINLCLRLLQIFTYMGSLEISGITMSIGFEFDNTI